jgi:hypothetical protein
VDAFDFIVLYSDVSTMKERLAFKLVTEDASTSGGIELEPSASRHSTPTASPKDMPLSKSCTSHWYQFRFLAMNVNAKDLTTITKLMVDARSDQRWRKFLPVP